MRILVRVPASAQLLVALPRLVLTALTLALVVVSWQHHVYLVFWLFGLPFLRWLRGGQRQTAVVVREGELELESGQWLGGPLRWSQAAVAQIELGRAGPTRLNQRAIVVRLKDGRTYELFVGLTAEQADFVLGGLQRWLASDF